MDKYQIIFENDQNILSFDEAKIIKDSGIMIDYFFENTELLKQSALNYCYNSESIISFDLYICDNATIQEINNDYRKKNEPTDVISFALFADCEEARIITENRINLGQIVISIEKTIEQAHCRQRLQGGGDEPSSIETLFNADNQEGIIIEELYFLLSHGILHLLGFDHQDEISLEFMLDIQQKMIESVKKCQNTKHQDLQKA